MLVVIGGLKPGLLQCPPLLTHPLVQKVLGNSQVKQKSGNTKMSSACCPGRWEEGSSGAISVFRRTCGWPLPESQPKINSFTRSGRAL